MYCIANDQKNLRKRAIGLKTYGCMGGLNLLSIANGCKRIECNVYQIARRIDGKWPGGSNVLYSKWPA
jgi:hypothetical protein